MTPAQQAALETLVARPLTAGEVAEIEPLLPNRNDVQIAAILSAGRARLRSHMIGIGTILAELAPAGGAFLDGLEQIGATDPNVKWLLKLIERGAFDVGLGASRAQMQAYATAMPELAAGINALLQLGTEPDPIDYNAVSRALNIAEGRTIL